MINEIYHNDHLQARKFKLIIKDKKVDIKKIKIIKVLNNKKEHQIRITPYKT